MAASGAREEANLDVLTVIGVAASDAALDTYTGILAAKGEMHATVTSVPGMTIPKTMMTTASPPR